MQDSKVATAKFGRFFQAALRRPVIYCLAVGSTLFTSIMAPGGFMSEVDVWTRLAVNIVNLLIYWSATYYLLAPVLVAGLRRGVPWLLGNTFFYAPFAIFAAVLYPAAIGEPLAFLTVVIGFACIMVTVALTVLLGLMIFRSDAEVLLEQTGFSGMLFLGKQAKETVTPKGLFHDISQPIYLIKAANQYVEIQTPKGSHLLRASLKEAIAELPPDSGFQIHRSVWISWDNICSANRNNGQYEIADKMGNILTVSRGRSDEFERKLRLRGSTVLGSL